MDTKYLKLKDNTWLFRMKIPKEIQFFYEGKRELLLTTKATKDNLDDAHKQRNYFLSKYKLQFETIKKEVNSGKLITPEDKLAIEHQIKIKYAQSTGQDELISEAKWEATQDVTKVVPIIESEKANPDIYDAVEKSDTAGKGARYLEMINSTSFVSYIHEFEKENKRQKIKQRGIDQKLSHIKRFNKFHPAMEGIDRQLVNKYKNHLFDSQGLVSKTIGIHLQTLGQYWDFMADNFHVKQAQYGNPFRGIKLPTHNAGVRQTWKATYFEDSQDDVKILLDTPSGYLTNNLRAIIVMAMFTGARIEELVSIKKEDIKSHYQVRCIYFPKAKTDKYHKFGRRYVPIASPYNKMIDKLISSSPSEYLINDTIDRYDRRASYLSKRFGKHKKRCGFPMKKTHTSLSDEEISFRDFHSFRTTLNTFLMREGLATAYRSALCGWNQEGSKSMADEVYLRLEQAYPYDKRKEDIESIIKLYPWFNDSYLEGF